MQNLCLATSLSHVIVFFGVYKLSCTLLQSRYSLAVGLLFIWLLFLNLNLNDNPIITSFLRSVKLQFIKMANSFLLLIITLVLLGTFFGKWILTKRKFLYLVFCAGHDVDGKRITRCNKAPIGGNIYDDRATKACGDELTLYCYNYTGKPYCETISDETFQNFKDCCDRHDRNNVWTKDIWG